MADDGKEAMGCRSRCWPRLMDVRVEPRVIMLRVNGSFGSLSSMSDIGRVDPSSCLFPRFIVTTRFTLMSMMSQVNRMYHVQASVAAHRANRLSDHPSTSTICHGESSRPLNDSLQTVRVSSMSDSFHVLTCPCVISAKKGKQYGVMEIVEQSMFLRYMKVLKSMEVLLFSHKKILIF